MYLCLCVMHIVLDSLGFQALGTSARQPPYTKSRTGESIPAHGRETPLEPNLEMGIGFRV